MEKIMADEKPGIMVASFRNTYHTVRGEDEKARKADNAVSDNINPNDNLAIQWVKGVELMVGGDAGLLVGGLQNLGDWAGNEASKAYHSLGDAASGLLTPGQGGTKPPQQRKK
jgi:hypothetical protein